MERISPPGNSSAQARVAELVMGNGLIMSHLNNDRTRSAIQSGLSTPTWGDVSSDRLGYDGAGRPITKRYLAGGINGTSHAYENTTSIVGFTTVYDRSSNKFYERHLHAESRSHLYQPYADRAPTGGYDSIDRLRQYQRGELSSTSGSSNAGGGSITTPISLPSTDEFRTYDLDGLGNWRKTSFEPVGDSEQTELRQHNGLNQITRTDDGTDVENFSYDGVPGASNGNLANDGVRTYEWDALNRLIKVYKTPDTPVLIGEYVYDALNRRIRKTVSNGGLSGTIPNGVTDFVYNTDWQCVEERDDENSPTKQYVWGIYIDELLQQKTFVTINANAAGNYYPLSDLLYRTTALTDSSGDIVEAYDCDAYGNTLIYTAAGTGSNWWADDAVTGDNPTCEFIFTGSRYDSESELYQYRMRSYAPVIGRFICRDPLANQSLLENGMVGATTFREMIIINGYEEVNSFLSQYVYVDSKVTQRTDSFGLQSPEVKRLPPVIIPLPPVDEPITRLPPVDAPFQPNIPVPPIQTPDLKPLKDPLIPSNCPPWSILDETNYFPTSVDFGEPKSDLPSFIQKLKDLNIGFGAPTDISKRLPWLPPGTTLEWSVTPEGNLIKLLRDPSKTLWKRQFEIVIPLGPPQRRCD